MRAEKFVVAKYLRLSLEDTDLRTGAKEESDSIANQRSLLDDFISGKREFAGAEVVEFCDDGWSGKNFERPGVKEMLEQVKEGRIQCIVVKDLSRFGRDYLTVGNYITRVFPFLGVRFIAVNDGLDSSRPMDVDSLETSFKTLIYDLYSRDLSRKVRQAHRLLAEKGDFFGTYAPYGYVRDPDNKKRLRIDPEAAAVVRRIFRMAGEGHNTTEIARTLNDGHVPTRMMHKRETGCSRTEWSQIGADNFWTKDAVTTILRDERYLGKNTFGKRTRVEVGSMRMVKAARSEWISVEGTHESIVTREEFDCAQERLRTFKEMDATRTLGKGRALFKKVRCGVCGRIMRRENRKAPYYVCHTPRYVSGCGCPKERMPENELLGVIRMSLRTQALYAVDADRVWEEKRRGMAGNAENINKALAGLKNTRGELDNHIRALYEKFAFGEMGKEEYLKAKNAAVIKRDEAAAQIQKLEQELEMAAGDGPLHNRFADCFRKYAEVKELTGEIIAEVLQEVLIYPGKVLDIVWNYGDDLKQLMEIMGR